MVYKIIEIIGRSDKGFQEAAENAVEVASKTVKAIHWVEIINFRMNVSDEKIREYQARVKIAFEVRSNYSEE